MKRDIPIAQLTPGDILLYRGIGRISDAIRLFDRAEVSHAALFLGRCGEKGRTVGEAITEGVIRRELSESIGNAEWVECRRLKEESLHLEPVLDRAEFYLTRGERYAFEQILLLAFLCLTRNIAGATGLGKLIRVTLDSAAACLLQWFDAGREPMICSEFVVRCYREAFPGAIDVPRGAGRQLPLGERRIPIGKAGGIQRGSALDLLLERHGRELAEESAVHSVPIPIRSVGAVDFAAVEEQVESVFDELQERAVQTARVDLASPDLFPSFERFAAGYCLACRRPGTPERTRAGMMGEIFDAAADFVTPGDLQRSKRLAFAGKLDRKGS